jgi:hypothetical protein
MKHLIQAVAIIIGLSGCWLGPPVGGMEIFARNQSDQPMGYAIDGGASPPRSWSLMGSTACLGSMDRPWRITVGQADKQGAVGPYPVVLTSDQVDSSVRAIWIDVGSDGSVHAGAGRPLWALFGSACGPPSGPGPMKAPSLAPPVK